jgi:hypothetical protein
MCFHCAEIKVLKIIYWAVIVNGLDIKWVTSGLDIKLG